MVLVTALVTMRGLWNGTDGKGWKETIRSDARGYYGYLQAFFIREDLGREAYVPTYVKYTPTGTLNKYYCGTSVMMAPWFGIGHALALQHPEGPQDGTSEHEQKAIGVGAWVYLSLGLLALRALLLGAGARDGVVAWVLFGLCLGTPLVQYAAMQPGWSHVYSFAVISGFLLAVHRFATGSSRWWLVGAGALLGLAVLIRPVNGIVLLAVPLVAGPHWASSLDRLRREYVLLLFALLSFTAIIAIQSALWHAQTGNWVEYGYKGEGFHWSRPQFLKVLVGFRRGLFLWTPLMLLPALCAVLLWRTDRWRSVWAVVYWVVCTYIISSWWIWYYGGGFASRVFIDHYPILVLPMVLVVQRWSVRAWSFTRIFIVLCVALNLAQLWQFHHGFLHQESMDRAKYEYTFLRFDEAHRDKLGGNYQEAPFNPNGMEMILEETCGMDDSCTYWSRGYRVPWEGAYSPATVCLFDAYHEFGLLFDADTDTLPTGRALYLEVGLQRFCARPQASLHALGVTEVRDARDSIWFYEPFRLDPVPCRAGVWEQLEYRIPVPPLKDGDRLSFYFWNQELRSQFLVDDVFIRVNAVRPY
ncbi:MAG: hypothetical protein JNM62_16230 [Flavobacteriales bacterium]|nr:hypothetical protein [Flavobacteriales bacterium]